MYEPKPISVISSNKAKEDIFNAKSVMDDMSQKIAIHQQNIAQTKMQRDQAANEQRKINSDNNMELKIATIKKL